MHNHLRKKSLKHKSQKNVTKHKLSNANNKTISYYTLVFRKNKVRLQVPHNL